MHWRPAPVAESLSFAVRGVDVGAGCADGTTLGDGVAARASTSVGRGVGVGAGFAGGTTLGGGVAARANTSVGRGVGAGFAGGTTLGGGVAARASTCVGRGATIIGATGGSVIRVSVKCVIVDCGTPAITESRGGSTTGAGRAGTAGLDVATGDGTFGRCATTAVDSVAVVVDGGSVRNPHHTLSAPMRKAAADGTTQRTTAGRQRRSTEDSRGVDANSSASSSSLRNCSIGDRPAAETASSSASMSLPDGGGTGLDARRRGTSVAAATGASLAAEGEDPSSAGNSVSASASPKSLVSATGCVVVKAISSPVSARSTACGKIRRSRRTRAGHSAAIITLRGERLSLFKTARD